MVLCPYVHLVMRYDIPPLTLQPSEVKSAHWVSLRALLSPQLKTFERQDVSARFFSRGSWPTTRVLRAVVGQLMFTARKLVPADSTYSRSMSDFTNTDRLEKSRLKFITSQCRRMWQGPQYAASGQDPPLILWGLTYGILANFLSLMPTDNPMNTWDWPTLSAWDIRFTVWILTYRFRMRKLKKLYQRKEAAGLAGEGGSDICGLDTQTFTTSNILPIDSSQDIIVEMLDGYFDRLRMAMWIVLAIRLGVGTLLTTLLIQRWRRSRLSRL